MLCYVDNVNAVQKSEKVNYTTCVNSRHRINEQQKLSASHKTKANR